ncbi:hypothetical protein PX554_19930 [Sphingomonas sp. H39-1-10]|uniref:hypothetical protein n=1 Tax=Sphingomonas pollutisoli TaxID=3030829 RepID=UPI0023B961C4|nr:hypothetical protein [Sphingomonas pollutisoli]MDF0490402.1 hypothetical protein [Sphingomonas pollutisoli]
MRIRHIQIFADVLRASGPTLAREYHSLMTAEEHEFPSEAARARYAAVVHAVGMMTDTNRFLAGLADLGYEAGATASRAPVKPVCRICGSEDVSRNATVRWDQDLQDWTLTGMFDNATCDDCGAESDALCDWQAVERPPAPLEPAVGARVRIIERSRIGGDRFKGREGEIIRQGRFGFYVRLDMTPRERVQKVELVEAPFLTILSLPADPVLPQQDTAMFNSFQRQCAAVFGGGDFAHVTTLDEVRACDDTLFTFLMIELSGPEDCTDLPEAVRRLEQAQCDIQGVLDRFGEEES